MAKGRRQNRLAKAQVLPKGASNSRLAEFVSTHDLYELMGTGRPARVKFAPEVRERTQEKRERRLLVALRLGRKDLDRIRQIARDRDVPYTALMRSWIRAGLSRESKKAG
jgi:hypothetical protein